jgi:hypothetical protein
MTQEISKKTFMPEVVDNDGKPVVGPDLDAVLKRVTEMAQVAQLAKIRKILEKQEFQGVIDPRTLNPTDQPGFVDLINYHPNTPWTKANFVNLGANTVYVSINVQDKPVPILAGGKFDYDAQMADIRITQFYYWCDTGLTSTLQVVGKY